MMAKDIIRVDGSDPTYGGADQMCVVLRPDGMLQFMPMDGGFLVARDAWAKFCSEIDAAIWEQS